MKRLAAPQSGSQSQNGSSQSSSKHASMKPGMRFSAPFLAQLAQAYEPFALSQIRRKERRHYAIERYEDQLAPAQPAFKNTSSRLV